MFKELDRLKLDFAQKRILDLCIYDETLQPSPSPNLVTLLIEAKTIDLTEDKLKVPYVDDNN